MQQRRKQTGKKYKLRCHFHMDDGLILSKIQFSQKLTTFYI